MDPDPSNRDLSAPVNVRPDLSPDQYRASEAMGSEMAGILIPGEIDFNEAEAAGLPRGSHPYVLTLEQSFNIALVNSRTYQNQLENIYLAALPVTLQRFAFMPQFFAGLSPQTGVAGQQGIGGELPARRHLAQPVRLLDAGDRLADLDPVARRGGRLRQALLDRRPRSWPASPTSSSSTSWASTRSSRASTRSCP